MTAPRSHAHLQEFERDPFLWIREFAQPSPEFALEPATGDHPRGDDHDPVEPDCQTEFLNWSWSLSAGRPPDPSAIIAAWPGGGVLDGASIAEMATVALGATGRRRFCLYISQSQKQAQEHLHNIKWILDESQPLFENYPELVEPARWRDGRPRGWSRKILQCDSGFIVKGVGLQQATHTSNIGGVRPDLIVFDNLRVKPTNAANIGRQLGSALAGTGPNPAFIVLNDSRAEHSLADALSDGLLPRFFTSRAVSRCD